MSYADLSEEKKEKSRESWRKWAAKNPDKIAAHNKKKRFNAKERTEKLNAKRRENPEYWKNYSNEAYHRNKHNERPSTKKEYMMWWAARKRATKKGLPFDIERQDVVIPDECPCCKSSMKRPSIDQVKPAEGYTKANFAVICFECNMIKSNGTAERHRLIADWMDSYK